MILSFSFKYGANRTSSIPDDLDAAYEAANKDSDRLEILNDWDSLEDMADLTNDEDWEWLKNG